MTDAPWLSSTPIVLDQANLDDDGRMPQGPLHLLRASWGHHNGLTLQVPTIQGLRGSSTPYSRYLGGLAMHAMPVR